MLEKEIIFEIFQRFKKNNPHPKSELVAPNNYSFAIAVLLSAQTTDKAVNKATTILFKKAKTPYEMILLGGENIRNIIKILGFFNIKTKNILNLSKILIEKYNSEIPNNREQLEKLPGIGRKSANVIMNELFNGNQIAVDTHVIRTSNRIGLTTAKNPIDIEKDLINIIPPQFHKNASNYLVLHGRYICKAKRPNCKGCPINDLCEFPSKLLT